MCSRRDRSSTRGHTSPCRREARGSGISWGRRSAVRDALNRAYHALITLDNETPQVMSMIAAALAGASGRVLEIGCGYGRYRRPLGERGIDAIGIDVNPGI